MKHSATKSASSEREKNLHEGIEAFRAKQWSVAFSRLTDADQAKPLETEDLEYLAKSAFILGKDAEGTQILMRAHQEFLNRDELLPASNCAFWLGFTLLLRGETAQAGGWLSRAERLLKDHPDCAQKGYLLFAAGFRCVQEGKFSEAYDHFTKASEFGNRFHDKDLITLTLNGQGRALIAKGEITQGLTLLDEAMVAVTSDEVSPLVAGGVYCSVIEACSNIFDLRRAQEWTSALEQWCSTQSDQLSFRGHCMLRRAEILQLHGAWGEAAIEAQRAIERFSEASSKRPLGGAFYRLAEIHRLRGEFAKAEEAYRLSNQSGATPQPGLALLRLAQGQTEAACSTIRRLAAESRDPNVRARVMDACVEIMLEAKDPVAAGRAATELKEIAEFYGAPLLQAMSLRAMGAICLAEGDVGQALTLLRQSCSLWSELEAPYDAARTQFLIALACKKQGDCDHADLEMESARKIFEQLGAMNDLDRVRKRIIQGKSATRDPLTARELEVLKLLASGTKNRQIANRLGISEKTVARHVSNIFMKLDLSSRAAATAYAYTHGLL